MAGKPVKIHPAALAELKSALTWYSEKSSATASKFAAELDRAVQLVSGAPKTWPTGEHGTRKFVLQHFPFAITGKKEAQWRSSRWPMDIGVRVTGKIVSSLGPLSRNYLPPLPCLFSARTACCFFSSSTPCANVRSDATGVKSLRTSSD